MMAKFAWNLELKEIITSGTCHILRGSRHINRKSSNTDRNMEKVNRKSRTVIRHEGKPPPNCNLYLAFQTLAWYMDNEENEGNFLTGIGHY